MVPCSDDPGMFPNSLTNEYNILSSEVGATHEQLSQMALRAVDACWLPAAEKDALRREVGAAIAELDLKYGLVLGAP